MIRVTEVRRNPERVSNLLVRTILDAVVEGEGLANQIARHAGEGTSMRRRSEIGNPPEAPLASLVHSDTGGEELSAFVERWQDDATRDPTKFMERLIDESERLGTQYETRTGKTGALGVQCARERLAKDAAGSDVASLLAILEDCAPPHEELPNWFQVMRRHQLMPADIHEILKWKPKETSNDPDITGGSAGLRLHVAEVL